MSSESNKVNLLGLTEPKLKAFLSDLGEKPFRAVQLMKWMHQQGITDFDQMTNISKTTRALLQERAEIRPPELVDTYESSDGCYKWTVRAASGSKVEMVFIPERGRGTLCVSSQVGCSLDCSFCATGKQGFNSDLTAAEIIGQLWLANRVLDGFSTTRPKVVTNVVMMGMGEPLLNFDNVIDAVTLMMDDNAYGLSKRRVTISTSGVVPGIRKMIEHTDASIAISLHAPNDELRNELVPINKKYPIAVLLESVRAYLENLSDARSATIEYTMISGVNDHRQHARELAGVLRGLPCKVNLIPFNPFSGSEYRTSSNSAISNFKTLLQDAGYNVTVRKTRGDEVGAACGQLVGKVQDLTRRSRRYSQSSQSRTSEPDRVPVREI